MKKKNFFKSPSNNFIFIYGLITVITIIATSLVIPTVLNYPPGSINTAFDTQMSYIPYYMQFTLGGILVVVLVSALIKLSLGDIDKWYQLPESKKYSNPNLVYKIRKKCLRLPYILLFMESTLPTLVVSIIFFSTGSHILILFIKLCMLSMSAGLILAVISYIFSKGLYNQVLSDTYRKNDDIGPRISLRKKIFLQIFPIIIVCILITSLVGYSRITNEKGKIINAVYTTLLHQEFDVNKTYSEEEILDILKEIPKYSSRDSVFIIYEDKSTVSNTNDKPSEFLVEYTLQLSEQYNGRTYDTYGLDTSGATMKVHTYKGTAYVGILYTIVSTQLISYYIVSSIVLIIIAAIIIHIFTKSLVADLHFITIKFKDIYKSANIQLLGELPIISNDEIGDLSHAFNRIQLLTKENIENIHDKQDMLVEKERLASLGQMIGGIAHNLKTPIMSIGGAAEGLSDLVKEYDNSIEDKDVTPQDHHEIAHDMNEWIDKIKLHTEYMSDVITAVKGQAVRLSDEQIESFSIEELLKHVTILMKHELKNSLIELKITSQIDNSVELYGNINILVQVINNIISNAIQAYNGKPNQVINFDIFENGSYIVFKVQDFASGIKKDVQEKLFKEMITTKGKNGTGLGLFMSYSTIKANFNGQLTFESEIGKGTTFYISIPRLSI